MNVLNNATVGFQIQYQLTFCLWVLTFSPKIASLLTKYTVIPRLVEILTETQKEKVIRMIVAFLRVNSIQQKSIRRNFFSFLESFGETRKRQSHSRLRFVDDRQSFGQTVGIAQCKEVRRRRHQRKYSIHQRKARRQSRRRHVSSKFHFFPTTNFAG